MSRPFPHDRLLAYQRALQFRRFVARIRGSIPRGLADVYDQLVRASNSQCLNLAEGASAFHAGIKLRHFRIANGSAGECASALDIFEIEGASFAAEIPRERGYLDEATALTIGLIRRHDR